MNQFITTDDIACVAKNQLRLLIVLVLCGVLWTGETAQAQEINFTVSQFIVDGPNPLSDRKTRSVLKSFLGSHTGLARLEAARDALVGAMRKAGHSFYRVFIPQQMLRSGTIHLAVAPFTLRHIDVEGNRHFTIYNIQRGLPALMESESPNVKKLSSNLGITNLNPAKQAKVTFSAVQEQGQVDAKVSVQDRRPSRFFTWLNNIGRDDINGETRLGVGFQHANIFNRDHVATLSYTTAPEATDRVTQYGAQYLIPLYSINGRIDAFFARSDVDSGTIGDFFDVSGRGDVAGVSYTQMFAKRGRYSQRVLLGVTDKLFDNDIFFEGEQIGTNVRSRPLALRYFGDWKGDTFTNSTYLEFSYNLPGGDYNNNLSYALARSGADTDWWAVRFNGAVISNPNSWSMHFNVAGQYANEPLIPGEQLGLGGVNSVRGFEQREVTGDRGIFANLELWTPQLKMTGLKFLAFLDGGYASLVDAFPGQIDSQELSSVGLGLTWAFRKVVNLELEYAYVLAGVDKLIPNASHHGDSKIHFNLLLQF